MRGTTTRPAHNDFFLVFMWIYRNAANALPTASALDLLDLQPVLCEPYMPLGELILPNSDSYRLVEHNLHKHV